MTFRSAVAYDLEDMFHGDDLIDRYRVPATGLAVAKLAPLVVDRRRFKRLLPLVMLPPADDPDAKALPWSPQRLVVGSGYDGEESPIMLALGDRDALFVIIGTYPSDPGHPDEIDGITHRAIAAAWAATKYARSGARRWTTMPAGVTRNVIGLTWHRSHMFDAPPRIIDPITIPEMQVEDRAPDGR